MVLVRKNVSLIWSLSPRYFCRKCLGKVIDILEVLMRLTHCTYIEAERLGRRNLVQQSHLIC
jgi:hypothetical protein